MTPKTLLTGQPDLFHEFFIIMFKLIKTILHLEDDIVLGLMTHNIQFMCCKLPTHTNRPFFPYKYSRNTVKRPIPLEKKMSVILL